MKTIEVPLNLCSIAPLHQFGDPLFDFIFSLPKDYSNQDFLQKNFGSNIEFCEESTKLRDYEKVSDTLIPGKSYRARLFPVISMVTTKTCKDFLKENKVIFPGIYALMFLTKNHQDVFADDRWIFSFDHSNFVPSVLQCRQGVFRTVLGDTESDWPRGYHLLCINEHS